MNQDTYDLVYFVASKKVETILRNKKRSIVIWKRNQLQGSSQYRLGKLVAVRN